LSIALIFELPNVGKVDPSGAWGLASNEGHGKLQLAFLKVAIAFALDVRSLNFSPSRYLDKKLSPVF
jgi:hypothetical protein